MGEQIKPMIQHARENTLCSGRYWTAFSIIRADRSPNLLRKKWGPQRLQRPHFILCFFLVLHCDCLAKNRISWLEHSRLKFCLVISNYMLNRNQKKEPPRQMLYSAGAQ